MTHAQTWASYSALYRFCSLSQQLLADGHHRLYMVVAAVVSVIIIIIIIIIILLTMFTVLSSWHSHC